MKQVKLKVLDRFLIQLSLDKDGKAGSHSLSELNQMLKIIDKFNFSEEERKDLNIRNEGGALKWNSENDIEKEFEIGDEQFQVIKTLLEKKDKAKDFDLSNLIGWNHIAEQFEYKFQ